MSIDQVFVISTNITFSLLKNFAKVLPTKFLKKANEKTTSKLPLKFGCFSFPLFYPECQFIQIGRQYLQKHFVCTFVVLSCLNYFKKTTKEKQAYNDLLCKERTLLCCLNIHLFTTAWFMKNIKEEKRPEDRPSGWWLRR